MTTTAYESSRQLDQNYYTDNEEAYSIKQLKEETYNQYISQYQGYWNEARIDQRFYAGDQTLYNELWPEISSYKKRNFMFNIARPKINMVSGHQRKHRKATQVLPNTGEATKTSEQLTKALQWAYNNDNVYNKISDAFESGALISGFSLLSIGLDRTWDISSGDIKVNHLAYNSFMLDHFFREQNMSDCSFVWTRKWVNKTEAKFLLPDREKDIDAISPNRYGSKDQRFYYMPENYQFTIKNLYAYDEYWYQDTRKAKFLYDMESGERIEWDGPEENLDLFLKMNPSVKLRTIEIPTVKLAISLNDQILYNGSNPLKTDSYPFVPVIGFWDPDNIYFSWRMQGLIRGLRDAQYLFNRRKVIELDILESQINSGMKVMQGSLVDNNDVLKRGQGQPLFIKSTAPLGMDSVQQLVPPAIPPTTIQLSQELNSLTQQVLGITDELMGMASDDQAGITTMLKQGAGLVTLEKLFDQLDLSQKILGDKTIEIIQKNWTAAKIRRVINEEPTEEFTSKAFKKYGCTVAEGLLTDTQQKLEFISYLNLQTAIGEKFPVDLLIDKAPIQGKSELKEGILKAQQAESQAAEMQQQMQLKAQEVDNQTKISFSEAQHSLAYERIAKVQEEKNKAITEQYKAEEEKTNSILNLIKVMKEIDGLDLTNLQSKVNILKEISTGITNENESKEESSEKAGK